MESDFQPEIPPNTKWVKGELLATLDSASVDPKSLMTREAGVSPFAQLSWLQRVAKHDSGIVETLVGRAWLEGQQCWLPLANHQDGRTTGLANWYNFAFGPTFAGQPGENARIVLLKALARRLSRNTRTNPLITLTPVARSDGTSDLITRSFARAGWLVIRQATSASWTADVKGKSFEDYWASRPGQLRNTYLRKNKKLLIQSEIFEVFSDERWAEYESVYSESWKTAEGSPSFLRDMAQEASDAGALRLGIARLDGLAVAAQFWTVEGGVAYIHKLAYREEYRDHSPGTILSAALFRHVIDHDKVDIIDFGTGDDGYKIDWMDRREPLDTIRLFKRRSFTGMWLWGRARISALVHRTQLD